MNVTVLRYKCCLHCTIYGEVWWFFQLSLMHYALSFIDALGDRKCHERCSGRQKIIGREIYDRCDGALYDALFLPFVRTFPTSVLLQTNNSGGDIYTFLIECASLCFNSVCELYFMRSLFKFLRKYDANKSA